MGTKKLITDTFFYGVIPKLPSLINIIILPLITPYLSTYDYGISGVVNSYTGLLMALVPLGMNVHLTNSFFEYPKHYNLVWGRVLGIWTVSAGFFGALNMVILFFLLPIEKPAALLLLCFVGSLRIFSFGNGFLAQHIFPLIRNPKPLVFTNLIASLSGILVSFILIYFFRLGFWGLVSTIAVSSVVVYLINVKLVWFRYNIRPILKIGKKRLIQMFRVALPLVPQTLGFVLLTSSARIVMSQCSVPYDQIGLFSHGWTMGEYIVLVSNALLLAIGPQIQIAYREKQYNNYQKIYYLSQAVTLLCCFSVCVWMPEIYSILIKNAELSASSKIACLLCFANVIMPLNHFLSTPAYIEKKTGQLLWIAFVPGILNVVLCYIFIPIYGYMAAVYIMIISFWSQIAIPLFVPYFKNNVKLWMGKRYWAWAICFVSVLIITLLCGNIISKMGLGIKILITVIVAVLFLTFYYKKNYQKII